MKAWIVRGAIILILLAGVLSTLYKKYYPIPHNKYYPNGQIFEKATLVNGIKNGPAVTYYANGALRSEDNYKNGLLDGEIKRYLENGVYFSVNTFKNGLLEGLNVFYYPTGTVRTRQMFKNNLQDGLSQFYYEDGTLQEETEFLQGILHGRHKQYYQNGQLALVADYKNSLRHGTYRKYSNSGLLLINAQYENGELSGINEWYRDSGEPKTIASYTNGVQEGPIQRFNEAGVLETFDEYRNETRNGISKEYYYSQPFPGELKGEVIPQLRGDEKVPVRWLKTWKNDKIDGPVKLFAKDGTVLAEFSYHQKQITGQGKVNFEEAFNKVKLGSTEEELLFDDLMGLLLAFEDFDQIEQLAAKFREKKGQLSSRVFMLDEMYQGLLDGFEEISSEDERLFLDILKRWIDKYPESITPRVLLVHSYKNIAWKYRGGGYANTISEEGVKKFREFIARALEAGREAMTLSQQDPELYNALMFTGLGASLSKQDIYAFLEAGRAVDADYDRLYRTMATVLLPRWGGRAGELEDFVDWALTVTQERMGFIVYAVVYSSVRSYVGNDEIREYKYNWEKLEKGFNELLTAYPDSFYYLNNYAFFATESGNKELSKILFERIGDRWDSVSKSVWDEKSFFDQRKMWAAGQRSLVAHKTAAVATPAAAVAADKAAQPSADLNIQDHEGRTPLIIAIVNYDIPVALSLIEKGANVNFKDNDKKAAIHWAAARFPSELLKLLLAKGAAANQEDNWGYIPLHYAASNGFANHIQTFLTIKNVNVNAKNRYGETALHLAANAGHIDVTKELFKSNLIDVNLQNDKGETPLHLTAQKGFKDLSEILLAHSADKTIKDVQGKTAADYALENGFEELAALLK